MRLLLGTSNPAKIGDYKRFLVHAKLKLITLKDIGSIEEPLEIGNTFEENALQKAKFYAEKTELPTLADDGGFEVDALDGRPGVESNRWLGPSATDEDKIQKILELMKGESNRRARLKFATVVYFPAERDYVKVEGAIEGVIPEQASANRIKGFPYRPILFLPKYNKTMIDLDERELEEMNYRNQACKELLLKLEPYLNS